MPIIPPHFDAATLALALSLCRVVGFVVGMVFVTKAIKARKAGRNADAIWYMLCAIIFVA